MINEFENKYKGTKQGIINSFLDILPSLQEHEKNIALDEKASFTAKEKKTMETVRPCNICGEASNQETCNACRMKEILENER